MRDLNSTIPGAKNFRYGDFIRSDTAKRYGIKNIPSEKEWIAIEKLATKVLQPIRDKFGPIIITSGYRSVELCLKVGSTPNSNHTRGEAADIEPLNKNIKLIDIMEWVEKNLIFRELIAEYFPDGWVHVAYRENDKAKIVKLKDDEHNYEITTVSEIKKIYKS